MARSTAATRMVHQLTKSEKNDMMSILDRMSRYNKPRIEQEETHNAVVAEFAREKEAGHVEGGLEALEAMPREFYDFFEIVEK